MKYKMYKCEKLKLISHLSMWCTHC